MDYYERNDSYVDALETRRSTGMEESSGKCTSPEGTVKLQKLVRDSFLNNDFSDVDVVVGEETFRAHQIVLAASSPVFK